MALHVGECESLDIAAGADDALAQRVVVEDEAARDVVRVDLDAVLVVVLVDLLEDQRALELDLGESRAGQELAEQVDRGGYVRGLQRELEQRVIAAGLGVERGAEPLDRRVERERGRIALGPPKQHVLDEVRQAVVLGSLET